MPLIPNPTRSSLQGNYDFVNQTAFDRTIWSLKFDHAFTANEPHFVFVPVTKCRIRMRLRILRVRSVTGCEISKSPLIIESITI